MFSLKIFKIHSREYISWKWTFLIEIWITWFQKELAIPQFQIPHMKSQKELWKSVLNLVSQGCQHEKIINFKSRIRTRDPDISNKFFDIWPSKPDTLNPHKAVHVKTPVEGTNLPNRQEWQSLVVQNETNIDLRYIALMVQWQNTC